MSYAEKIVVFGGTSFIGTNLCNALSKQNCNVISINNPSTHKKCEFSNYNIHIDICIPYKYDEQLRKVAELSGGHIDCIYIASWAGTGDRNNEELNKASADGLLYCISSILQVAKCKKIIQLGSQAEYGRGYNIVTESTPCNPLTAYGRQKLRFSRLLDELCKGYDTSFIEFRIHSIYGRGRGGVIEWLINQLINEDIVRFETNCNQLFDYVYIDDCVEALLLGKRYLRQGVYNISSGKRLRLRQYFEIVKEEVNPKCNLAFGDIYDMTSPDFVFDSSKLRTETGWETNFSFRMGIMEMVR